MTFALGYILGAASMLLVLALCRAGRE